MTDFLTDNIRFNKTQKYLTLDFESENLNVLSGNRPWQASWLIAEGGEIQKTYNYYLKWPDLNVSRGAAIATNFDAEKVNREGKDPLLVLQAFEKLLLDPSYKIVFFNGLVFDVYLHGIWRKSLGLRPNHDKYINRCIDVHALFKAFKINIKLEKYDDFLMWQYKLLNYHARGVKTNLTQACKDLHIEVDESKMHNAEVDTAQTFLVLLRMLKEFNIS